MSTNSVPPSSVSIVEGTGAGSASLIQPQLLILGVPNDTTNLFPTIPPIGSVTYNPGGTGSSAFATPGPYGLKPPVDLVFFGDFTAANTGSVYDFLTLQGPTDNSNSFGNWQKKIIKFSNITADNFGIYVFALTWHTLDPKGTVTIGFSSLPPNGTLPVAYGQDSPHDVFDMAIVNAAVLNLSSPPPLTFWDGPGPINNNAVNGGTATWPAAGNDAWTS